MNYTRYTLGSIAIFIIFMITDYVIHGLILGGIYMTLASLWRPDMVSLMWIMYLGRFIFSFIMMYVFIKGYEARGVMEGLRFGLMIGLMTIGIGVFYEYSMFPIPLSLTIQWFIYGILQTMLAGVAAALIYKPLEDLSDDYS